MGAAASPKTSAGKPSGQQKPLPAKPKAAPVSASAAVQKAVVQKAVVQGPPAITLPELDLATGDLAIPDEAAAQVQEGKDLDVNVRLPGLAEGALKLRKGRTGFGTVSQQAILLHHPALGRFSDAHPLVLALAVKENKVSGFVGLGAPGPVKGNTQSFIEEIRKGADLLQWAGLSKLNFPNFRNRFEAGVIDVGVDNLTFTLGGFLSGTGSAALDNKALSFEGGAKIAIPGGGGGELGIKKGPTGDLFGKLDIQVQIGSVAGTVQATLSQGFVSVMGKVAYSGDRLSGSITLAAVDEATARDITLSKPSAGSDVPIELPGPDRPAKPGRRAFCGWGTLTFRVTDWLAGAATVIVNSKGQATIIGEIAPPKQFTLFEIPPWRKQIFKLEIKAGYGIPVVGTVGLFANIGLYAVATVGPALLKDLKLSGAYSTDPRVAKNLTIEGNLHIDAYAGLELSAEAGLVVTILGHDIKAGVNLTAKAGVRGYVDATPRIGMRELAPGGKREYFIEGHLELAAQPVLGFSGDLFVAIETPWWSPLSDKRWTWPLFSLEYPLPGEFGIGADVSYVLGSKKLPEIEFGEVDFDSSKFMGDLMNDNTDKGSGKEKKKKGDWGEGLGATGPGGAKNKGGSGKKPGEPGYDDEPVGESMGFSDGKEAHKLWFAEKDGGATLMVASTEGTVPAELKKRKAQVKYLLEADRATARGLIASAEAVLPKIDDEAKQVAAMKQAERKAEAAYKKYGKKKGPKGKKTDRKEVNKRLKGDERALEQLLINLFTLMRMEPLARIKKQVAWTAPLHGRTVAGKEPIEIAAGEGAALLRIGPTESLDTLAHLEAGPLGATKNPGGRDAVKATEKKLRIESKAVGKVPMDGKLVQARANTELESIAGRVLPEVGRLGQTLKVKQLDAATKVDRMKAIPVSFNVNATPNPKYQKNFKDEMERQLKGQEEALNLLNVDTWVVRVDTYKSKLADTFTKLDNEARKAVAAEIREKLADTEPTAGEEHILLVTARERFDGFMKGKKGGYDGLTRDEKKRYFYLQKLIEKAEQIGPARAQLKIFLEAHPDLAKLTAKEREDLATLSARARVTGRSGQEEEFQKLHAEGIQELTADEDLVKRWKGIKTWGSSNYALLHNPDQVAGGHGTIADLTPVKKPVKPKAPTEADRNQYQSDLEAWEKYKADLTKYVGQKQINSIIGGGWGKKIVEVKSNYINGANYTSPTFGLWFMDFKLGYSFAKK